MCIRRPASRLGGSRKPELQLLDHWFPTGQRDHPGSASRQLSRLRQLRSQRHRVQRFVAADHRPYGEHQHERRRDPGRLPHGERPGPRRGGPGGPATRSVQRHLRQLPTQPALHVRGRGLDRERPDAGTGRGLLRRGSCDLRGLVGGTRLQQPRSGTDQQREPRPSRRDHHQARHRRLPERLCGRSGADVQPRFGHQRRRGAVRIREWQRRPRLQRGRLRTARVAIHACELARGVRHRTARTWQYRSH